MTTPKTDQAPDPRKARFDVLEGGKTVKTIETHFNPASLQISISTKLEESKNKKKGSRQAVNESSAKLSVELVFDTTDTLTNVSDQTVEIARLMGEQDKPPPQVMFAWGSFQFTGIVDSYKETLEFFSEKGVPLRSSVSLTMLKDEDIYSRGKASEGKKDEAVQANPPPPGGSTTTTATQAGAPGAGRFIAALNGVVSMRFPGSQALTINASVQLAPPVAFTSPGAGLSATASFGASGSSGLSLGTGGSASAGISLSQGAFAGLRTASSAASPALHLDPRRLVQRTETYTYAADDSASFDLGGRMKTQGSRLDGSARARIRFEEG